MQITPSPLEQYKKLSPFEQALMQFISIVYEPAHSTLIVNCLRKLELKNPRGNRPTVTNLNHYLSKFKQLGLLTKERQCSLEVVEIISKIAVEEGTFALYAKVIQSEAPVSYYYGKWTTRCWRAMREMRIGVYTQKFDLIDDAQEFLDNQCRDLVSTPPPTVQIMTQPFDLDWFCTLPTSFQFYLLSNVLQYGQETLTDYPEILAFLSNQDQFSHLSVDEQLPFKRLLFNELLFQGRYTDAEKLVTTHKDSFQGTGALGAILFLKCRNETALASFEEDILFLKKYSNSENVSFFGPTGLFYILARISSPEKDYPSIANQIGIALLQFSEARENDAYNYLATVVNSQISQGMQGTEIVLPERATQNALTVLFAGLCQYWLNSSIQPEIEAELFAFYEKAQSGNYHFFTLALGDILSTILHDNTTYLSVNSRLREKTDIISLLSILEPEEPWKRSLQALIYATSQDDDIPRQSIRLVWIIAFEENKITISPREQKLSPNQNWSKGKPISLSRLYQTNQLTYLTPQDRKICAAIRRVHNVETQGATYHFDMDKALVAMTGHPLLFLSEPSGTPVEFVTGEPELLVEERGDFLHIRFAQPVSNSNINYHRETPTRVKIITINDNHRRIAQITGKDGMTVPLSASEQVLTAIGNISSFMTVHSAIAADHSSNRLSNITYVDSDSTTYIHLIPYGTGFRLEMFVKPFTDGGHYLKPGQGVENIMAEVKGKRLQTKRNLALEEENARDVEELCPILDLAIDMEQENDREWHLQDPDDCLQALSELQAIRDKVRIEWPEGEKLTITQKASLENLNLKIRTNRQNWFAMSGHLTLDQGQVIELKELLSKIKSAPGRFVEIAQGQFIALTQEFRKRLEDMNIFSDGYQDDDSNEILIHPVAAMVLGKLTDQTKTVADEGWKEQTEKIREAQNFTPEIPSTLQAELRDYQKEGYYWLTRLAHWGVGGCLADDMGLGKTVQALTIVLKLAANGPSLVVAPTSVSTNWQSEVTRFTPTINIKFFSGKDRRKTIRDLGKFDLLITTYTLL